MNNKQNTLLSFKQTTMSFLQEANNNNDNFQAFYKERNKLGALINPLDSKIKYSRNKK